jgi:hypothetical protein
MTRAGGPVTHIDPGHWGAEEPPSPPTPSVCPELCPELHAPLPLAGVAYTALHNNASLSLFIELIKIYQAGSFSCLRFKGTVL